MKANSQKQRCLALRLWSLSSFESNELLCGFMALYNYYDPSAPGLSMCQEFTDVFLFSVYFILRATLNR